MVREIESKNVANNKIGVSSLRKLVVFFLPDDKETRRYPVVYFLPNPLDKSFRSILDEKGARGLLDRGIATGATGKFILLTVR